jgi:hypothetical protein
MLRASRGGCAFYLDAGKTGSPSQFPRQEIAHAKGLRRPRKGEGFGGGEMKKRISGP